LSVWALTSAPSCSASRLICCSCRPGALERHVLDEMADAVSCGPRSRCRCARTR
jgi:hypothetical protein